PTVEGMTKHAALAVVLTLLFAGVGSAAVASKAQAPTKHPSAAVRHEKRLGPKPTPRWYWGWVDWRLGEGFARGHVQQPSLRPRQTPSPIPRWAWRRLHFFLLARAAKGQSPTPTKPPTARGTVGIGVVSYGQLSS